MVEEVVGLTIEARGPAAPIGELCRISRGANRRPVLAEVCGFRGERLLLLPLGRSDDVEPGALVTALGTELAVPVGPQLLGRVVDAVGRPVDDGGPIRCAQRRPARVEAPPAMRRRRVTEPLWVGVRAVDGLLTCAKGQRVGIFAGSGVGKSVLLGMMARNTSADVTVIALVGERGREVLQFVSDYLGDSLGRCVVVVATSDEPPLTRLKAGLTATTIAEHFRGEGMDVLLLMDSLTRLARAQREVGLSAGEVPTTRGYPPSVFTMLPELLERAGAGEDGTITALYTVLVEADDMNEPVADAVRATLDGHIVLSRELANHAHYPAVDITRSISRLMQQVVAPEHRRDADALRRLLAAWENARDLISIGAYQHGSDRLVDEALGLLGPIRSYLQQEPEDRSSPHATVARLRELVSGHGS
ncbi:MAG: FliI/YscN family ATPase [candidate division WS1 bacterium]|jgi:flagellum-specific ATP synthase|nr:FliI/YscN family ATPase [candidate division WS1 bacterium]